MRVGAGQASRDGYGERLIAQAMALIEQQDRQVRQIVDGESLPPAERVSRRDREREVLGIEGNLHQGRITHGLSDDGDIEFTGPESGEKARRLVLANDRLEIGCFLAQRPQQSGKQVRPDGRDDADAPRPGEPGPLPCDGIRNRLGRFDRALRHRDEPLPRIGHQERTGIALNELYAEDLLQRRQRLRECRLGHTERSRGVTKVPVFDKGQEGPQLRERRSCRHTPALPRRNRGVVLAFRACHGTSLGTVRQTVPMSTARPVIGMTTYVEPARWGAWDVRAALLHEWYLDAVRAAGGRVVLLPPDTDDTDVLDRLDALVIIGGADVGPLHYGAEAHATTDAPRTERDASEIALCRAAIERDLPLLGICRGLQIMAVAQGGALIQDLPSEGFGLTHREMPGTFTEHAVRLAPDSLVASIYGAADLTVNSSHHQGVADPGTLTPTGWAQDGLIEVCEVPGARFGLGVQWHPEHPDRRTAESPLFAALVLAARRTAASAGKPAGPARAE